MIIPIVFCGGSCTPLWPLSRKSFPKQFVPLIGNKSLLQLTLDRVSYDLAQAKQHALLKANGHKVNVSTE
jgi:mannose-1-phosphate guanylyltransferase